MADLTSFLSITARLAKVELTITESIAFKHFYHGNIIRALIIHLLKKKERWEDHSLSPGLVPIVLEDGQLVYQSGDVYTIGLLFLGNDLPLTEKFNVRLANYLGRPEGILRLGVNARLKNYVLFDEINLLQIFTRVKKNVHDHFTIRILTPLAIDREKQDMVAGHSRYDQQLFKVEVLFKKIIDRFNNLCRSGTLRLDEIQTEHLPPVALQLLNKNLMWLELPTQKRKKNYGGVVGSLEVAGKLDDFWLMALIAGSILHIGEKINFGFGFYDIPEFFTDIAQILKPKISLIDRALSESNLSDAFLETKKSSKVDGENLDEFEEQYAFLAEQIREKVKKGTYKPAPLKGLVAKQNKKVRALAVPTVVDRWLQRAVLNILAPTLDTLFEDCSYAYRRNYSRQQAQLAIQQAYRQGYRYVLEADIENFFDEVEWDILLGKLRALFPFDPAVDLMEKWIKAPVMFRQKLIQRQKGLPQGAVISPLLSNLYLDEFDESIQNAGFKLVRFADDFVILCKHKKQAEKALRQARIALKQLDLEIKESKTGITHFDDGFRYLGYLFCRSVVLETFKEKDQRKFDWALLDESKIPPNSWLANARFNGQTLEQFLKTKRRQLFKGLFNKRDQRPIPAQRTVYLGDYQSKIKVKNNQLMIFKLNGDKYALIDKIPLELIQQIVLLGPIPLSMPALFKLMRKKIAVLFTSAQSKPVGMIEPVPRDVSLWIKQEKLFNEAEFKVSFSRSIVMAKIHNFLKNLQYLEWAERERCFNELSVLKNSCLNKNSVETIRGIEGRAAAVYFRHLATILGKEWNFSGRKKHLPADGINALLSLGYTILYNYLSGMIMGQGLNPQKGIYHASHANFNALSSDLQEEFRFMIDRLILTLINRKQITPERFKQPEKRGRYFLLSKEMKHLFIKEVEKKLHQRIFWRVCKKEMSYMEIMNFQVIQIKELILKKRMEYQPFIRR